MFFVSKNELTEVINLVLEVRQIFVSMYALFLISIMIDIVTFQLYIDMLTYGKNIAISRSYEF